MKNLRERFDAEKPQRKVDLDGYWMYKYEVTVAQYRKFCEATNREMPQAPGEFLEDDHPMVMVTWQDAADYAKWAGVSLPTEAQWEKAARGTDGVAYPWGKKWDAQRAKSTQMVLLSTLPVGNYGPVGSHTSDPNPYGCMDMAGNASEWCSDWYAPDYYKNAPTENPTGPSEAVKFRFLGTTIDGVRVSRGGSWASDCSGFIGCFRWACRDYNAPSFRHPFKGFRCARTP